MGLLTEGTSASWEDTKKYAQHVREHGILQFINLYKKIKDRDGDVLKFGDEIEYILVKFFDAKKQVKANLRSHELLKILNQNELDDPTGVKSLWRPEFCSFMIESSPGQPYGGSLAYFNTIEANMRFRRKEVTELLNNDEAILSISSFARLGCEDCTYPPTKPTPNEGVTRSLYLPDEAVHLKHPRFVNFSKNIRMRRGENVAINVPVYKDKNTKTPLDDSYKHSNAALPDHVYMDATGFGHGCCCLQATFQARNITEARSLYDQLVPMCPITLAITAASPLHRGFITDIDCFWKIISDSSDCRTEEEQGLKPLKENKFVINKSRYDSVDCYLSPEGAKYNDIPILYNEEDYKKLVDNGVDPLMAQHIAHLFIRDTISLISETIDQNDEEDVDHFENIQSTNWQSLRFKIPVPDSNMGWRVEFRPCDSQITDFQNAAVVCFIVLLTRAILAYELDFLMPISKVDENMRNALKRNAVNEQKFWFRRHITTEEIIPKMENCDDMFVKLTINEIINGKEGEFPGLVPIINNYLSTMEADADTRFTIQQYLKFIQGRASGEILTNAAWIRKFVTEHPDYRHDSVVTELINYDLLKTIEEIQSGKKHCHLLEGTNTATKTKESVPMGLVNGNNGYLQDFSFTDSIPRNI